MKTYIRFKFHKQSTQNIKQIVTQQKYRLGKLSNIKLLEEGGLNDCVLKPNF